MMTMIVNVQDYRIIRTFGVCFYVKLIINVKLLSKKKIVGYFFISYDKLSTQ